MLAEADLLMAIDGYPTIADLKGARSAVWADDSPIRTLERLRGRHQMATPMQHPQLTIRGLRVRAVDAPLANPIRTAVGEVPSAPLVLVDILTEEGVTGRSYLFAYTPVTLRSLVSLMTDLEPELVGRSVSPVERMRQLEMRFRLVGQQGLIGMAIGAIDMALWDALGCAAGLPVVSLLGGEVRPLPAYDSYGIIDPVKDAGLLERSVGSGFRAIKVKIGGGTLEDDVRIVGETRRIIGPDVKLMVDYNQSQTVPSAVERIRRLSEFDLAWVEEPVGADDLHGHRRVRAGVASNTWLCLVGICSVRAPWPGPDLSYPLG